MKKETLNKNFEQAVDFLNSYKDPLPADILLKLYAYYKIANKNYELKLIGILGLCFLYV